MAIMRTVRGGAGRRDTVSAALAFASVTMSARTPGAAASRSTARSEQHTPGRQRIFVMGQSSLSQDYPGPIRGALAQAKKSVRDAIVATLRGGGRDVGPELDPRGRLSRAARRSAAALVQEGAGPRGLSGPHAGPFPDPRPAGRPP